VKDFGVAVDQGEELLGYTVNFVSIRQTHDLAPLLKGLPDDLCQCPHWGYVTKGRMTVHYLDHDEVIEAGDAFYMPPGHSPAAEAGTEVIQFSPTRELQETEAAIRANVQAAQQG
ncbi:MAG TPA: hypothetical protein VKY26_11300, partial [Actinomycetota bacterium]|nr:hypothetical protein [Actinomycetota bacterium]